MEGVPEDIIQGHNQRVATQFQQAEAERQAVTGNPPAGQGGATPSGGPQPAKRPKLENVSDLKKRLAEHKAKKAEALAGGSSGEVTPVGAGQTTTTTSIGFVCPLLVSLLPGLMWCMLIFFRMHQIPPLSNSLIPSRTQVPLRVLPSNQRQVPFTRTSYPAVHSSTLLARSTRRRRPTRRSRSRPRPRDNPSDTRRNRRRRPTPRLRARPACRSDRPACRARPPCHNDR